MSSKFDRQFEGYFYRNITVRDNFEKYQFAPSPPAHGWIKKIFKVTKNDKITKKLWLVFLHLNRQILPIFSVKNLKIFMNNFTTQNLTKKLRPVTVKIR